MLFDNSFSIPNQHTRSTSIYSDDELNKLTWEFARYKETHTTALTDGDGVAGTATTAVMGKEASPLGSSGETETGVGTKPSPSSGGSKFSKLKTKDVDKKVSSGSVSFHPQIASSVNDNNNSSTNDNEEKPVSVAGPLTGLFSMFGSPAT